MDDFVIAEAVTPTVMGASALARLQFGIEFLEPFQFSVGYYLCRVGIFPVFISIEKGFIAKVPGKNARIVGMSSDDCFNIGIEHVGTL